MLVALIIEPNAILENYTTIIIIVVPTVAFIYLIIKTPQFLIINNIYFKKHNNFYSVDHKYYSEK